jgi:hypothetical protein
MSDDEELKPGKLPKEWLEKLEQELKQRDDELVARWQHFYRLAVRMISHDGQESYSPVDVQHFAEMLLLLDIARGSSYSRFRSRYAGNF